MIDLLAEFPLGVYYPFGGIHYLLQWHCHDEQNHVIVARSESMANRVFERAVAKYRDTEARRFLRVDLVAPPPAFAEAWAKNYLAYEIQRFWNDIALSLQIWRNPELPPGVVWCGEYGDTGHYCERCVRSIRPETGTLESVYLEKRAPGPTMFRGMVPSQARQAREGEEVRGLLTGYGHHSKGVWLDTETTSAEDVSPENRVLLYYVELESIDMTPLVTLSTTVRERVAAKAKKDRAAHSIRLKQREQQDRERVFAIFTKEKGST